MKILHTSDLHLGVSIHNVSLVEAQEELAQKIVEVAKMEKVGAVVIAGDVYDHAVSGADAIAVYNTLMTQLCAELRIPVLVCAGNHDGAARLAACGELLACAGLYIAGGIRNGLPFVDVEDSRFHLLPYFSMDEAKFLYPHAGIKTYNDAMAAVLTQVRQSFGDTKNILVSHCYVSGAEVSDSDRSVMVGGTNMVSASLFEGFDYVALGHLHKAQDIGKTVRYSGSPMKLSFSEAGTEKTLTVIDTHTMQRTYIPVRLERDMRVVKGTYAEALAQAERECGSEDYIKVVLTDEYAHLEVLKIFQNAYRNFLALEGKSYRSADELTSLSVEEVKKLSETDIMMRFFEEYTGGEKPTERQMDWFLAAGRKVLEEDGGRQ